MTYSKLAFQPRQLYDPDNKPSEDGDFWDFCQVCETQGNVLGGAINIGLLLQIKQFLLKEGKMYTYAIFLLPISVYNNAFFVHSNYPITSFSNNRYAFQPTVTVTYLI